MEGRACAQSHAKMDMGNYCEMHKYSPLHSYSKHNNTGEFVYLKKHSHSGQKQIRLLKSFWEHTDSTHHSTLQQIPLTPQETHRIPLHTLLLPLILTNPPHTRPITLRPQSTCSPQNLSSRLLTILAHPIPYSPWTLCYQHSLPPLQHTKVLTNQQSSLPHQPNLLSRFWTN